MWWQSWNSIQILQLLFFISIDGQVRALLKSWFVCEMLKAKNIFEPRLVQDDTKAILSSIGAFSEPVI